MSRTNMRAGRLVAMYVDDGPGRRVVLGDADAGSPVCYQPITLATTQREMKAAIATLHQLCEELPP